MKSRTSNVRIGTLPCVLQDVVFQFAYNMPRDDVLKSLDVILTIIDMKLPFFFFREKIWSWHYNKFLTNPIRMFLPIEYFNGQYCELFDDDAMFCLLLGLDFRRRSVKMFGSRQRWLDRIMRSWKCVEPLAAYYKMLMRSQGPIMKQRGPLVSLFV